MSLKLLVVFGFILVLVLIIPLAACSASTQKADTVTLQLNWYHAAEFAGYYMAEARGYYRDANLDVKINQGGPGIAARNYILDGRADFAVASFDEQKDLLASGKPALAVMAVFQIPPMVMFALADAGINEPRDMIGKKIGIKNDYWLNIERKTLLNAGIDPSQVIEVQVPVDAQKMLYDRQVDVWMGYAHDEPVAAEVAGYKVKEIFPADYGVGGYEGLLLTAATLVRQKPELADRFVTASRKGLQYALEHPDETAQVMAQWQPKDNLEYCKLAIRALIPLVDIPQSKIGWIDAKRWEQLLGESYNAQHPGYTMQFLQDE
jgi:ABC-type nitrate/sulfonate/bicarbonate transport system substrate-binding protein